MQGLKVAVVSAEVTLPAAEDQFPVYGEYTVHAGITQGKAGGHNDGDRV